MLTFAATTEQRTLCDALRPRIMAYAKRLAGPDLCEDIVQETYMRLLTYRRGRAMRMPVPFILAVARNVTKSMLKQRARASDAANAAESRVRECGPRERAEHDDAVESSLHQRLGGLPERQREALILTEVCGLSETQAALVLAMSRAAVGARKRAALVHLRELISMADDDERQEMLTPPMLAERRAACA